MSEIVLVATLRDIVIGMAAVVVLIIGVGIYSGRHVKNSTDFLIGGGRVGLLMTCGTFVSTLIGSQLTLGAAQMAYDFGILSLWFMLGVTFGCIFMALFFTKPMRKTLRITQFQIIADEYGRTAGSLSSTLCIIGTAVSFLSQVIACTGFVAVLFPSMPHSVTAILAFFILCGYILFGGALGMGMGGVVKMLLLYVSCIAGMGLTIALAGGITDLFTGARDLLTVSNAGAIGAIQPAVGLSEISNSQDFSARFLNMFQRGFVSDTASFLCTALGILSTQIYMQFLKSARDEHTARIGTLLGGLSIVPVGVAGACIGLFMRAHSITQAEANALIAAGQALPDLPVIGSSLQAFPAFVLRYMPPLAAGVILGTLLITIISGAAGLMLGITAIIVKDIISVITHRFEKHELFLSRIVIVLAVGVAMPVGLSMSNWTLNDLGFLSMILRATVVFVPFVCSLWFPSRIAPKAVVASILLSPITVILANLLHSPIDPMCLGMFVAAMCCVVGAFLRRVP